MPSVLMAEDAKKNHIVPSYDGTAELSTNDSGATLPASVTFNKGYASFQVTFGTTGQQTVTATDSVDNTLAGAVTVNVASASSHRGFGFGFSGYGFAGFERRR